MLQDAWRRPRAGLRYTVTAHILQLFTMLRQYQVKWRLCWKIVGSILGLATLGTYKDLQYSINTKVTLVTVEIQSLTRPCVPERCDALPSYTVGK